jgi:hypothetical protein
VRLVVLMNMTLPLMRLSPDRYYLNELTLADWAAEVQFPVDV